jgi:hypothetical protein
MFIPTHMWIYLGMFVLMLCYIFIITKYIKED